MFRLDYVSCCLTILSTVLLGKRLWPGWIVAAVNSVIICIIGMKTVQFGLVAANLFCIGLYANYLWNWRRRPADPATFLEIDLARKDQKRWSRGLRANNLLKFRRLKRLSVLAHGERIAAGRER